MYAFTENAYYMFIYTYENTFNITYHKENSDFSKLHILVYVI